MVQEVWLHIGTPKSGTSSLQKYLVAETDALSAQGLAYITPPGKEAANDLAIAFNRKRDDLPDICAHMNRELEVRPEKIALISSEMLYGFSPAKLSALLPALPDKPLKVLVYLRRQDKYIESMFLQKSKNGRFVGTIDDYIAKFDGSGSDYHAMLREWRADDATLVPRVMERDRLVGGDVIADALTQMGLPAPPPRASDDVNVSPGIARVQLLQVAAATEIANPRKLQRTLAALYPQDPATRGNVFTSDERRAFLNKFKTGNDAIRATYFPDYETLFDESDLSKPDDAGITKRFDKAQLDEIFKLLKTLKSLG